ncbi:hypothetical protein SBRCBS47491_005612 [Sporothrix bragantina]|uniref:Uncharacterized protein n=1 Tax=Sporothrix bragantina TaxID=671064 RepID=A0ABP0BYZ2_9PEZI
MASPAAHVVPNSSPAAHGARTGSSSGSAFPCTLCSSRFSRREHLRRHERSHMQEKPFQCATCLKSFARSDILSRHAHSHRPDATQVLASDAPRACCACAVARVRCNRGRPCLRCRDRGVACVYPGSKSKRKAKKEQQAVVQSSDAMEISRTEGGDPRATESTENSIAVPHHPPPLPPPAAASAPWMDDVIAGQQSAASAWAPADLGAGGHVPGTVLAPLPNVSDMSAMSAMPSVPESVPFGLDMSNSATNERAASLLLLNWISPPYNMTTDWDQPLWTNQNDFTQPMFSNNNTEVEVETDLVSGPAPPSDAMHWQTENATSPATLRPIDTATAYMRQQERQHHDSPVDSEPLSHVGTSVSSPVGRYYLDGGGSRAPFRGHGHEMRSRPSISTESQPSPRSWPPLPGSDRCAEKGPKEQHLVSGRAYETMLQHFRDKLHHTSMNRELDMADFPLLEHIRTYTTAFFEQFHPTFSFVRKQTLASDMSSHWILLLAVATMGAMYTRDLGTQPNLLYKHRCLLRSLLGDVVRRRMLREWDEDGGEEDEENYTARKEQWMPSFAGTRENHCVTHTQWGLPVLQAAVLHVICLMHSGDKGLMRRALREYRYLADTCQGMQLLRRSPNIPGMTEEWREIESRTRTGMMIWSRWDEEQEEEDEQLLNGNTQRNITLTEALEMLYMEKRLLPQVGEFGALLIIHAVYRQTNEVVAQSRNQLLSWTPSAEVQPRKSHTGAAQEKENDDNDDDDESWPHLKHPVLHRWRNGASDCLDVLHWSANARAAQAAGCEHPTVLFLHLARLLLLTPLRSIQVLADEAAAASATEDRGRRYLYAQAGSRVRQWTLHDPYKARLALVHAGALLWHVRRFSSGSFLEPFAIYRATLTLWAYGVAAARGADTGQEPAAHEQDAGAGSESPEPSLLYLDRPLDDELVQMYVRLGHRMTACVQRVGNICSAGAPRRIVQEGIRLLVGVEEAGPARGWGIESSYAASLRGIWSSTQ